MGQLMLNPKLDLLKKFLEDNFSNEPVSIAFSGGLDSRFLAYACDYLGFPVKLYHISGPHLSRQETIEAQKWANERNFPLEILSLSPLAHPEVQQNSKTRCYHCKKCLFSFLLTKTNKVCDGTNHSDLGSYRPGIQALQELKILSPLAKAGLSKREIRLLGEQIGLDNVQQPSRPCLLTRFPYDSRITFEKLANIERVENKIQEILDKSKLRTLPFRVREVKQPYLAIHIAENNKERVSAQLVKTLEKETSEITSDRKVKVIFLPTLSGYFDTDSQT